MAPADGVLLPHLRSAGVLLALLVVVHAFVPRRLHWREDLASLSLVNRQIFEVHTMFIVLTLSLMSALLLANAPALLEPSSLARALLLGLTIFWSLRLAAQLFYYSPKIWRGDRFNTIAHGLFSALWIYLTATFSAALWVNLSRGGPQTP